MTPRKKLSKVQALTPGSVWAFAHSLSAGERAPPTFCTHRIAAGKRHGVLLVRVLSVCSEGCHALIEHPMQNAPVEVLVSELLLPS